MDKFAKIGLCWQASNLLCKEVKKIGIGRLVIQTGPVAYQITYAERAGTGHLRTAEDRTGQSSTVVFNFQWSNLMWHCRGGSGAPPDHALFI